ncbi:ABC transporter ATP-binding protein [Mycobacterium antarcticum]|nr:ABC transporter ATP-binding protein [Mycolicibacterium sp. TUM20985]
MVGPRAAEGEAAVVCGEAVMRTFGEGAAAITAVRDATFTVAPRARIALAGPSGSGKSTLLHLVAGLDIVTAGTLAWPSLATNPVSRLGQIGTVFQGPSLIPALDVIENVRLPMLFAGVTEAAATVRAAESLARLGIVNLTNALPDELSGGQAQRVAVARVLAAAPRLILADEPTGQLDHHAASLVVDVLLQAADESGAALIVSTHDPAIAARLPTEWTMHDGRLHTPAADVDADRGRR